MELKNSSGPDSTQMDFLTRKRLKSHLGAGVLGATAAELKISRKSGRHTAEFADAKRQKLR